MSRKRPSGRGKKKLPALAFGNQNPNIDTSAEAMSERMRTSLPWEVNYLSIGDSAEFEHHLASVNINGLRVVSTASTPIEANIADAHETTLMIPLTGHCVSTVDGHSYEWDADKTACLMPKVGRSGFSTERSALMLDLDPAKLQKILQAMTGGTEGVRIDLESPQSLKLHAGGLNFSQAYAHICGLIDSFKGDQKLLDNSGLDDLLYRLTVMLLRPDIFCGDVNRQDGLPTGLSYAQLCEYILGNLSNRISMSELEFLSGVSARTLQYQFKQKFGCSPMRWISLRRLEACRARLLRPESGDTVTSIALAYGFTNLGNFARLYAEQFNELPSKTLQKAML